MAKRKKPIIGVHYSYVGTDADFEKFLHALVRDYLSADSLGAVDTLHSLPQDPSVQSVDSGAA